LVSRRSSLTTRGLAADYLALCRNPLNDIRRWVLETGKTFKGRSPFKPPIRRSAHAQSPSPSLAVRADGFRVDTLHAMHSRLDPLRGGRQSYRLSSRPRSGPAEYDELRSLRAARGETASSEAGCLPHSATANSVAPSSSLAAELAAAKGYYASRIAAARQSLSPTEIAAAIQAIQNEQTLASRAIIQRWEAYFQSRTRTPEQNPSRPHGSPPVLRYADLRKN
jgi:hypothetical protein